MTSGHPGNYTTLTDVTAICWHSINWWTNFTTNVQLNIGIKHFSKP